MAKTSFKIEGLRELDEALGELPKAVARGAAVRTLMKAGKPIQEAAQAAAPHRPSTAPEKHFRQNGADRVRRPGTLQILVQIGPRLTKRQARGVRAEGKNFAEVYIGTRDPAGRLVERGTSHSAPNPFLRNAWEGGKMAALEVIKTELWLQIDAAAQRLAKRTARLAAKGGK